MVFYTFKQNRFQESLYSTEAYCLKDDPTILQSHSLCNNFSLFTSYILIYPSKNKLLLKRGLQNNKVLNHSYSGISQIE